MSKTTNKYSPEVRERTVRLVLDNQGQHETRWSSNLSLSSKIDCVPQTLNEWVKKVEVDRGEGAGFTTDAQSIRLFCIGGARSPVQDMIAFVEGHRADIGFERICKLLPIAPSTFYDQMAKCASARAFSDCSLRPVGLP